MVQIHFNGYYLTATLLALCTVIGIVVAAKFRREADEDLVPTTTRDLLDPLEKAFYSGLMRPDEIERIRASVKKVPVANLSHAQPVKHSNQIGQPEVPHGDPMYDQEFDRGPISGPNSNGSDETELS